MKNTDKNGIKKINAFQISENDEIFDPVDNLYNTLEGEENLTFRRNDRQKSNKSDFLKKREISSNNEI